MFKGQEKTKLEEVTAKSLGAVHTHTHTGNLKTNKGITLIALVITILFSYDEKLKYSNNKGFLLATI
jgi:hypothetical protein